jgi:glycosyltransferase involved in cell wall biosynthesis
MDAALISIVIPYYNKVNTIHRSVKSVLNQTYSNWELILIDDTSDIPLKEIFQIEDKRVQLLLNKQNSGPGPTRQRGLDIAKGEYIAFLDADDWWEHDFLMKQMETLRNEHYAIASWCPAIIYTDKSKEGELRRYNEINHQNLTYALLKYGHSIQTSAFLWRKKLCGKWGDLSTNQDSFFEFSSSIINAKIVKTDVVLLLRDETGEDHRSKYVNKDRIYLNTFKLYSSVFDLHNSSFSCKHRILLFHRFLVAYHKVLINTGVSPYKEFKARYRFVSWCLGERKFLIKLVIKLLSYTPFRFHY